MMSSEIRNGVMLNAYPDSIGSNLGDMVKMLKLPAFKNAFSHFYILPTFFNSDLDRGFSIIDYDLNENLVSLDDISALKELDIKLKFDIVLNHLSVASPQFQDLIKFGSESKYKDFFIDWNEFWSGHGTLNDEGVVIPDKEHLDKLFMRKSGLPILKVVFPDGSEKFYWNTFYQKVEMAEDGSKSYLGQMDVNAKSPLVWQFYEEVLSKVKSYGCQTLRLDAFAYLHKEVGESNFFNKPGTWEYLSRINDIAIKNELILLPEIHAEYGLHLHDEVAKEGYVIYDFFLPGLILHAIEKGTCDALVKWADEIIEKNYQTINMLGCHDGIPMLDLKGKTVNDTYQKGLIPDEEIEELIKLILDRGGRVKNLYGADGSKISYYQVNATYFSSLGESEHKLLLARAIQLFMPGTPQIWYLDIFAGVNDHEAADRAGAGGHKEINRTNLSSQDIAVGLERPVVLKQLEMIRMRNLSSAFNGKLSIVKDSDAEMKLRWQMEEEFAELKVNFRTHDFRINYSEDGSSKFITV